MIDFILSHIDSGLIIFFLGLITISSERMRREICVLKKVAWINHPKDMN